MSSRRKVVENISPLIKPDSILLSTGRGKAEWLSVDKLSGVKSEAPSNMNQTLRTILLNEYYLNLYADSLSSVIGNKDKEYQVTGDPIQTNGSEVGIRTETDVVVLNIGLNVESTFGLDSGDHFTMGIDRVFVYDEESVRIHDSTKGNLIETIMPNFTIKKLFYTDKLYYLDTNNNLYSGGNTDHMIKENMDQGVYHYVRRSHGKTVTVFTHNGQLHCSFGDHKYSQTFQGNVTNVEMSGETVFVSSSQGVYIFDSDGSKRQMGQFTHVACMGNNCVLANSNEVVMYDSRDPFYLRKLNQIDVTGGVMGVKLVADVLMVQTSNSIKRYTRIGNYLKKRSD